MKKYIVTFIAAFLMLTACIQETYPDGGEIVDEYYKVSLVKVFNDEKDRITPVSYISYSSLKDEEEDIK